MTESEVYNEIKYDHRRMLFPTLTVTSINIPSVRPYIGSILVRFSQTTVFQTRVKHPNMPVMHESHPFIHMFHY